MRVLLVHNNYRVQGGAEVFFHEVGRVLEENGHKVAYLSAMAEDAETPWKDYFPLAADYIGGSFIRRSISLPQTIYNIRARGAMARLISDFKPDVIHAFAIYVKLTPSVLDAAHDAGVPVVMSCNDYKHICPNYKLYHHGRVCEECKGGRFYRAVVNHCCHDSLPYSAASAVEAYVHNALDLYRKNVNTFLFASEFMARKTEEFWGKSSFRWRILRNPFNSTRYKMTFCPSGPVIFFGRLIDEKGVDILIRAAASVPDIEIRIIGNGPDEKFLKTFADDLRVENVVFAGPKWGAEMDEELKASRFVIVPSIWHENFPYVINQSFAYGKPVVGSNRGGIPELVSDGERGLVYEASDSNTLAEAIRKLVDNPQLIKQMGRNAKEFSDREFNDELFYNTLLNIYSEVVD